MGFIERANRLAKANVNDLIIQSEYSDKALNSKLFEMQESLSEIRQSIAHFNSVIKRTELQYNQANSQANSARSCRISFNKRR